MRENIVLLKVKYTILILIIGIILFLISVITNNKILFLISILVIILSPYISLYIIVKRSIHPGAHHYSKLKGLTGNLFLQANKRGGAL